MGVCAACRQGQAKLCGRLRKGLSPVQQAQLWHSMGQDRGLPRRGQEPPLPIGEPKPRPSSWSSPSGSPYSPLLAPVNRPDCSHPKHWVAVAMQPLGTSNPTGTYKPSDYGFLEKETWGEHREMTFPSPQSTCSSLIRWRHIAALQGGLCHADLKAAESPQDSINTECQCGLTVKPCVAAECCVSKLDKIQQSSGQKMSRLTHQTTCLKVGEI